VTFDLQLNTKNKSANKKNSDPTNFVRSLIKAS
jgi:hypothetical protein